MRTLITGGSGFIGTAVAEMLVEEGQQVVCLDIIAGEEEHSGTPETAIKLLRGKLIQGDITSLPDLEKTIKHHGDFETIVHLAALRNTGSQENLYNAHCLNATGMVHVLETARNAGVKRVVYASTVAVYGSPSWYRALGFDPNCVTEQMPPKPYNMYGVTKLYDEMVAVQFTETYGIQTVGLRLAIVLGPGKKSGSKTSEFNDLIEAPLTRKKASIRSYGEQKLGFIYLPDAALGFVRACLSEIVGHRIYNIGAYRLSTKKLVAEIRRLFPEAQLTLIQDPRERSVASAVDSRLAEEDLGFQPRFTLEQAIRDHHRRLSQTSETQP